MYSHQLEKMNQFCVKIVWRFLVFYNKNSNWFYNLSIISRHHFVKCIFTDGNRNDIEFAFSQCIFQLFYQLLHPEDQTRVEILHHLHNTDPALLCLHPDKFHPESVLLFPVIFISCQTQHVVHIGLIHRIDKIKFIKI